MKLSSLILLLILFSCNKRRDACISFPFTFQERTMIVNEQLDNTLEEEDYLFVKKGGGTKNIDINFHKKLFPTELDSGKWILGWGSNKPYYDAGSENLREILEINTETGKIILGELLAGEGFPQDNQPVVFWNTEPSSFKKIKNEPILDPRWWPEFAGESMSFGGVIYDANSQKWIMYVNEADTNRVQVYAAISNDLINWKPANQGAPLITTEDLSGIPWASKEVSWAMISDIIKKEDTWHYFFYSYDNDSIMHIGTATASDPLNGPLNIHASPVISPNAEWNAKGCFYGKVSPYMDGYVMFYDGIGEDKVENVGMAFSTDLIDWQQVSWNAVLTKHMGWRSATFTSEPVYVETRKDSIFLMVQGAKAFKDGFWERHIANSAYMKVSGNVDDAQYGVFLSVDEGRTFIPHVNNPVFVNNYADPYENEHLGGNFELIKTDSCDYIFYQGKSGFNGLKYNVHLRVKHKVTR